jgi:hypothetical protein
LRKYLIIFGLIGILVPFFFEFVWHFVQLDFGSWFVVFFWPGFLLLADPSRPTDVQFGFIALATAFNGLFYSALGFFLWGLFHRNRWFLAVFALPVAWFCYRVFVLVHS